MKKQIIILILQVKKKRKILMQNANCFPSLAMNGFEKYNKKFVINKTSRRLPSKRFMLS
jgi:hypothetical protein